ncbi:MAG: UTP--glucose-1-phosphate uridylyltransferase [Christensenellales bacterium]|jgi:UTP--glucose-1-phosphate uridylyltransferase
MIKKAVILAAGYGTRFLPATKAICKEMFPVVDKPAISYVVDECIDSGINEILIILGRGKESITEYFGKNIELEQALKNAGKYQELNLIKPCQAKIFYTVQESMQGTAKAVGCAEAFCAGEPFALLFPDDIMVSDTPVTAQLARAYETTHCAVVGVQAIERAAAVKYGVIKEGIKKGRFTQILDILEKPDISEVEQAYPLTSLGRFILPPGVFDFIEQTKPSPSGEYYLPDTIKLMAKSVGAYAYEFEGVRYDTGDKLGYIKCNIELALRKQDLGKPLAKYLKELVESNT